MIFLVDGDNNINDGLAGIEMLSEDDRVLIFHSKGMALTKIKKRATESKANVQFIESTQNGKNSVDFQIIVELGVLVGQNSVDFAYVISQDQGYLPSITALKNRYAKAFKEVDLRESIEQCIKLPFVMRATNKQELHRALVKEYGIPQGSLLYKHLKAIYNAPCDTFTDQSILLSMALDDGE